jgi:peptide/nickel transport system substrate-binding protein
MTPLRVPPEEVVVVILRRVPLLAVLAALMAAAVGCGSSTSDDTGAAGTDQSLTTVSTTPAATADVDHVKWALFYEPTTMNWTQAYAVAENTTLANMCESLLRQEPDFSIKPGLAQSVENPTPLKWVYRIRGDVRFWDGKPLTADDVVYSLKTTMGPASYWSGWFGNVRSVERSGPDEVTVTLKRPDSIFNKMMATAAGIVVERAYAEEKGDAYGTPDGGVMCTGPFEFQRWNKGDSIVMTRNENYWNPSGRAHARTLELRFVPDESTLTSALLSGDIDGTFSAPLSGVSQLRGASNGSLTLGTSTTTDLVAFSASSGPLADPRVRRALSLAIDRTAIAKTVFSGTAHLGLCEGRLQEGL